MIRAWLAMQLDDRDLPEHYVVGKVNGIEVSLQVRVAASVLNPHAVAERIAAALAGAGVQ